MDAVRPVAKPAGGFRFVTVQQWCQLWSAFRTQQLRLSDVRVWCALQEALARRCLLPAGHPRQITAAELQGLVGPRVPIRPALTRLTAVALVRQQHGCVTLPEDTPDYPLPAEVITMLQYIPNPRRRIPVPRRVLRFLARCRRRSVIATVLGHLVRCLYYRQGHCHPVGCCAASWIATVFGLSLRSIKTARQYLERLGLLQRLDTPHWVRTRYGQKIALNLQWEGLSHRHADAQDAPGATDATATSSLEASSRAGMTSAGDPSTRLPVAPQPDPAPPPAGANHRRSASPFAPPPREAAQVVAPPDSHRKLSARIAHQEPAAGRPAGRLSTLVHEARAALRAGDHLPADTASALSSPRRLVPPPSAPPPVHRRPSPAMRHATSPARPTAAAASTARSFRTSPPLHSVPMLRHITRHDLRDTRRVLQLYEQAVTAGLIAPSDANRLTVVALAQHVLAQQPANPGGLFWRLLTTRQFSLITQAEEDAAQQRLKTLLYGDPREEWRH